MANQQPRDIPLPIQRQVRQRCGFGCVICGLPLYEYDHLDGWAETREHDPARIVLLCDFHHREKTNGLLPPDVVESSSQSPFNFRSGVSKPYDLHFSGNECHAWVGGNHFSITDSGYGTAIVPVSVDGIALLAFILADGHLLLTLIGFDESNTLVLRIQNNRLIHSTSPWDIELTGRTLIVRDAPKQILVDILFEVPNTIRVKRGRFLCNGVEILVRPDHVLLTNNSTLFSGNTFLGCAQGIVVGSRGAGSPAAVFLPDVNRYLGDRTASVAWAREMLVKPGNGSV